MPTFSRGGKTPWGQNWIVVIVFFHNLPFTLMINASRFHTSIAKVNSQARYEFFQPITVLDSLFQLVFLTAPFLGGFSAEVCEISAHNSDFL